MMRKQTMCPPRYLVDAFASLGQLVELVRSDLEVNDIRLGQKVGRCQSAVGDESAAGGRLGNDTDVFRVLG